MFLVDALINLIGLLLLLGWRASRRPSQLRGAGTLLSNLRPAESRPAKRWGYAVALAILLLARPVLYSAVAMALNWTPMIGLGPVALAFRADSPSRLVLHSLLSFGWSLMLATAWATTLILLLVADGEPENWSKVLKELLGRLGRWPFWLQLLVPSLLPALAWAGLAWPLVSLGILPGMPAGPVLALQSVLVGASVWLSLKWLFIGLLLLRLLNTYIYFGNQPFWDFIQRVGGVLLKPLSWLPVRFGKLDFTPVIASALIWGLWWALETGLSRAFARLNVL